MPRCFICNRTIFLASTFHHSFSWKTEEAVILGAGKGDDPKGGRAVSAVTKPVMRSVAKSIIGRSNLPAIHCLKQLFMRDATVVKRICIIPQI